MAKNKLFIGSLGFLILLGCCKDPSTNKISLIMLTSNVKPTMYFHADQFFDSVRYIFLESKDNCMISQINAVFFENNRLIIFDKKLKKILIFNEKGEFISSLSPFNISNNYIKDIQDVAVKSSSEILILDGKQKSILVFFPNGNFQGLIPIHDYAISFHPVKNNICLYMTSIRNGSNSIFRIIDDQGNTIKEYNSGKRFTNNNSQRIKYFTFYDNQDSSFLFSSQDNTQYLLEDNKSIPFRKIYCSDANQNQAVSDNSQIINLLETKDFYFVDIIKNRILQNIIYDKNLKQAYLLKPFSNKTIHLFGLQNSDSTLIPLWPSFKLNDNWLCQIVDISTLKKFRRQILQRYSNINFQLVDNFQKKIDQMGAIDNPILVLLRLKDNINKND
ncbi:MAG: 6-bladed beta-propeller [Porphyromonadaceae bacterium]|nr:MAG: 6-bladed beta-propeller [Porphyromonadaceae bacterium]